MESLKTESLCDPRSPHPIRVLLVYDHLLFREGLARLLAAEDGVELVGACTTPAEALKVLKDSGADVILLDIAIAREFILSARKSRQRGKFLVLATEFDPAESAEVLQDGAAGVFRASDSPHRLMEAIRLVAGGEAWLDQKVLQFLAQRYPRFQSRWNRKLSEREKFVLRGVVDGLSNRKIGSEIGVSESTIKAALQQLFRKAGVRTRSQLVRVALEGQTAAARPENGVPH